MTNKTYREISLILLGIFSYNLYSNNNMNPIFSVALSVFTAFALYKIGFKIYLKVNRIERADR